MSDLTSLPNVGKVLLKLLTDAGITSAKQLRELGTEEAFIRIRMQDPTACIHMLYGLEGAVEGIPDKLLDPAVKEKLKEFHRSLPKMP